MRSLLNILLFILALLIGGIIAGSLSGCASQELAQRHWTWLTNGSSGVAPGYTSGVTVTNYTVNGQGYQVVAPAR